MTQSASGILSLSSQSTPNPVTEYFKKVIRDSGIRLSSSDGPNLLIQEQALVVRDIEKTLEANEGKECIDRFLRGFKVLIRKEKYLKKALLPSQFKKAAGDQNGAERNVEIQQESLFRIFLKVNRLQNEIIEIILDQLTSTISDEEHEATELRLLLSQIRYLPHIKNPENMTTRLLDVIDVAPFPSQLEILDSIPEILPDSEYNETAKELAKMLDKSDDLSGAIIDCLNALNLSSDIRTQIQDHILSKMLIGTATKTFPVFLDFLLTDCNARNLCGTLMKIRNAINNIMAGQDKKGSKEKESAKILIFNCLQKTATSKLISESWLTVISGIKSHTDHKPVDLLILFMLHSSTKLKKRTIETTFRKRIKEGQFKSSLLEQFFEKYLPQQLLRDYFTTIVEVGSSLLRGSNQAVVTEFAATLFKLVFGHQYTERTLRQEILENMIVLVGASDQKNVTAILKIIVDLIPEISKNPHHAIILMRLLEKLDSFELKDVKLVFEILCSLTCSEESLLASKEELHMIVRKRLSSSKRALKHTGIISAVVMAKHIATVTTDQSETSLMEDSISSINELKGAAKEAADILELTNTSTRDCPDLQGLYYDQLASMLRPTQILYDKSFLSWLNEIVTSDFTNIFTTGNVCDDINDLQFSRQYDINSEDEIDHLLAVNIAELTLKPEKSSIVVLAPHFRLLRLLHHRHYNGDLSNIDALLGCPVILPKTDQIDSLSSEQIKQTTDCLFHCINWFREVISGFVLQKNRKLRLKVIERLNNLYELEKLLNECLENIPEHKLPTSYFEALTQATHKNTSPMKEPAKPTKRPRKLVQAKRIEDTTAVSVPSTSNLKSTRKSKDESRISFREMDTDVVKLLRYPLNSEEIASSDQTTLNINQLNFILKDYVTKLSLLMEGRDLGLLDLTTVTPTKFMTDVVTVLPHMNKHLNVIINELSRTDLVENTQHKNCFGLILESLSLIFSWPGFHHSKNLDLLRNVLKALRPHDTITSTLNSVNHLIISLVDRIADYTDHCSFLLHAVHLIKIMEALHSLAPNSTIRSKIAKTAGKLLNKDLQKRDSVNIDILIRSYLSSANIRSLCGMVGTLQEQASTLIDKNDSLEMLKCVTKSNLYVFYRNLWSCLHDRVKTETESLTNTEHLTLWRTTALTMQGLMTVVKAQESKFNLVCFLKKSIAILKIFLSHGIPILEIELKFEPDRVVEILKTIQTSTRFLHHLCCHSKVTKDASLMTYVPQFRLTLETLIYRVKAALVANRCSEAFWMGNLKNRDLQGEEILTQSTEGGNVNDNEEEEGDEEMPSDVDSDDAHDDIEYARGKSGSQVYE